MRKTAMAFGAVLLAGLLAGCTAPSPVDEDGNAIPMSTETFTNLIYAGDGLTEISTAPSKGSTVYWNAGAKDYSESGRYSAYFENFGSNGTDMCLEDDQSSGSVMVTTKGGNDYNTYYKVSLTEPCESFSEDISLVAELDGPGRFDLKVSARDDKAESEEFAEALQSVIDEKAANEPDSSEPPA